MIGILIALVMAFCSALAPAAAETQPIPTREPTPVEAWTREGIASWMPERFGPDYLALPIGPGNVVELCGPGGCLVMTSTDAGPNKAMLDAGRIADIAVVRWEQICGVDRKYGLCPITWTLLKGRTP